MSTQYPGGFITKSPVAPTSTAASGIWTVDQALQYVKAGTWPSPPIFIEDLFSTYLYTGNSSTQTITNNINLSTKGGLVWIKARSQPTSNELYDTSRGVSKRIFSDLTNSQSTNGDLNGFTSSGFSLGYVSGGANGSGTTYASWTFAEQSKFFDVVTYTGNGGVQTIAHNLGSTPGCIIVKSTSSVDDWAVYHRGTNGGTNPQNYVTFLNLTNARAGSSLYWNDTAPTSTNFTVSTAISTSAQTYVAYLFAHDAGGFPASGAGSTNGISCGFLTTNGSGQATVTLGYEPQWILIKKYNDTGAWVIIDNMRGWNVGSADKYLMAQAADTEGSAGKGNPTATGFLWEDSASASYIYVAIRRGPMKTPTVGTSVFKPTVTSVAANTVVTTGIISDLQMSQYLAGDGNNTSFSDRLRGFAVGSTGTSYQLYSCKTDSEAINAKYLYDAGNTGWTQAAYAAGASSARFDFSRAPSFFDIVCYTGTGAVATHSHNLGVTPEMMIVKKRNVAADWQVYHSALGPTKLIELNLTGSESTSSTRWNDTAPTASVFTVGTHTTVNASGATYVAYLFATLAGISKVGSFTGTAALQTINCGFTTGARFVLIKRYDAGSTGDWYVWDSANGISSGNDPYFIMNVGSNAQVTGTNYVDTDTTGFKVTAAASTTVNISAATYIFLAIA